MSTMRILWRNITRLWKKLLLAIGTIFLLVFLLHPGRFAKEYPFIAKDLIPSHLVPVPHSEYLAKPLCPILPIVENKPFSITAFPYKFNDSDLALGGGWKPKNCNAQHKIAIIIPYRNRAEQLKAFTSYMHGFLQAQLIDYQIYVVEQSDNLSFNRAILFNIGYIEVLKRHQIPCFIFHDVDLLPENIENVYACTTFPRHMSSSVNTMRYKLPYLSLSGGVLSILQAQFNMINGFPNRYFGWGGEDDDLYLRVVSKGMTIVRFSPGISKYYMLPHKPEPKESQNDIHLLSAMQEQDVDGLNNLKSKYKLLQYEQMPLYTLLKVKLIAQDKL